MMSPNELDRLKKQYMKFIDEHEDLFNNNNYDEIYAKLAQDFPASRVGIFTKMFFDIGENPLIYMKKVPKYYLATNQALLKNIVCRIPTNVEEIRDFAFGSCVKLLFIPDTVTHIDTSSFTFANDDLEIRCVEDSTADNVLKQFMIKNNRNFQIGYFPPSYFEGVN